MSPFRKLWSQRRRAHPSRVAAVWVPSRVLGRIPEKKMLDEDMAKAHHTTVREICLNRAVDFAAKVFERAANWMPSGQFVNRSSGVKSHSNSFRMLSSPLPFSAVVLGVAFTRMSMQLFAILLFGSNRPSSRLLDLTCASIMARAMHIFIMPGAKRCPLDLSQVLLSISLLRRFAF